MGCYGISDDEEEEWMPSPWTLQSGLSQNDSSSEEENQDKEVEGNNKKHVSSQRKYFLSMIPIFSQQNLIWPLQLSRD